MQPIKIDEVLDNARPDHQKFVIGPPPGYENEVGSLEMLVADDSSLGGRVFRCYYELTDTERTAIAEGAPIEFSVFALQMVPVGAQVAFWHKGEAKEKKTEYWTGNCKHCKKEIHRHEETWFHDFNEDVRCDATNSHTDNDEPCLHAEPEVSDSHPVVGQDGPLDLRENGNGETSDS